MSAISSYKQSMMRHSINLLFKKMTSHIKYDVTHDEFIDAFIPPHLREMARSIPQHFDVRFRNTTVNIDIPVEGRGARIVLDITDYKGALAPMIPRTCLVPPPDHPVMLKVTDYLMQYAEVSKQFSLAMRVLEELDKRLGSDAQMRFFWPAVLILLEQHDDAEMKATADKLRVSKPPRNSPYLPEWVRTACRDTSASIAAASMIPLAEPEPLPVTIRIQNLAAFDYAGERIKSLT